MTAERLEDLIRFYNSMNRLENKIGRRRWLADCKGMKWPERGVYFFMEDGEQRTDSGQGLRIVRVGTHALTSSSKTTLWQRLSQHKGSEKSGGGNHRGSIFRLLVGTSLDGEHQYPAWKEKSVQPDIRVTELPLEQKVSRTIRAMPFLWLAINDFPDPSRGRGYIERNSIALLSNAGKEKIDAPSTGWLGHACTQHELVKKSGLWNQDHVNRSPEPGFLDELDRLIDKMEVS